MKPVEAGSRTIEVRTVTDDDFSAVIEFAELRSLTRADFASLSLMRTRDPRMVAAWSGSTVIAAAIDDGLATSIAGDPDGITAIGSWIDDLDEKLVISGPVDSVRMIEKCTASERHFRPELFMAVHTSEMRVVPEALPIRVATLDDIEVLAEARVCALEEEYDMHVERGGTLAQDLRSTLELAINMQGVAVWIEADRVAFTAQLIAKTQKIAVFGDLYTDPQLRGAGRATRGLAAFCAWLMTESEHVGLRVGVDNVPARRLYDRIGFTAIDSFASSLRHDARTQS